MEVRILNETDAAAVRELRLRSLHDHPSAYGTAYEEEEKLTVEHWADRLKSGLPDVASFGVFIDGQLAGINALVRNTPLKLRHRAMIVAMYTLPEHRQKGVGQALVQAALDYAQTLGVEDVVLAVTVGNDSAKKLYEKMGFQVYSYDPRFIQIGDQYFDLEWMIISLKETS